MWACITIIWYFNLCLNLLDLEYIQHNLKFSVFFLLMYAAYFSYILCIYTHIFICMLIFFTFRNLNPKKSSQLNEASNKIWIIKFRPLKQESRKLDRFLKTPIHSHSRKNIRWSITTRSVAPAGLEQKLGTLLQNLRETSASLIK